MQQIDRVVEVVEETLKGEVVKNIIIIIFIFFVIFYMMIFVYRVKV